MAARRGKSQARRTSSRNSGMPGWAWLIIGILLAVVAMLALPRFLGKGEEAPADFFRVGKPAATDPAAAQPEAEPVFDPARSASPAPSARPAEETPKARGYDFYEVLPGEEVVLSDAQLAAIAREEARRRANAEHAAQQQAAQAQALANQQEEARRRADAERIAQQQAAQAQALANQQEEARRRASTTQPSRNAATQAADAQQRAVAAARNLPQSLPETTPAATARQPQSKPATRTAATTQRPQSTTTAPARPAAAAATPPQQVASIATPAAASRNQTPYIVQAGAFQASGDAEAAKARIALLGLNARVESAQINGKTVYRVRMGPYASAAEAAAAKQKLENGGLQAMTIQAK